MLFVRRMTTGMVLCILFCALCLTGALANDQQPSEAPDDTGVIGQIVEINDNAITLMAQSMPLNMEGMDQAPPVGRDGDAPQGEAPGDQAPLTEGKTPPQGQGPQGDGRGARPEGMQDGMMPEGEEITYTLAEDITVTNAQGESIDFASLATGDRVFLTLDDDEKVVSIQVMINTAPPEGQTAE